MKQAEYNGKKGWVIRFSGTDADGITMNRGGDMVYLSPDIDPDEYAQRQAEMQSGDYDGWAEPLCVCGKGKFSDPHDHESCA